MNKKRIETHLDFDMAMSSVHSSIHLLDLWDWDHWLRVEALFQVTGSETHPELHEQVIKDPQWKKKVAVIRAAATYMKAIRDIRDER